MAAVAPDNYRTLIGLYQVQFDAAIAAGEFEPFVYPKETLGALILILYFLVPHDRFPLVHRARVPLFIAILALEISTMRRCRSMYWSGGFGIGLISSWGLWWSFTMMLLNDPQRLFKRIEWADVVGHETEPQSTPNASNGNVFPVATSNEDVSNGGLRHAADKDDMATIQQKAQPAISINGRGRPIQPQMFKQRSRRYAWQPYPVDSVRERLEWVADLMTNFRGIGWNWRISGLPEAPREVLDQLGVEAKDSQDEFPPWKRGPTGNIRYMTRRALLRQKVATFSICYVLLDLCKVILMCDPYFWGFIGHDPPNYLPSTVRESHFLTKSYRLLLSLVSINAALEAIFTMGPLFFSGILGERLIGARAEPWMYPDLYGSFWAVLDKGLAGWWGGWWHQIFRFAFAAPSTWIVDRYGLDRKSTPAKMLQVMIAFAISGSLHACGSYTQLPTTRPITGPFLFFFIQSFGIIGQTALVSLLKRYGMRDRCPKSLRLVGNFVFALVWLYFTAPLLTDDFARGGIWLFEPVPISPIRGLGYGLKGEGWWCWGGHWVHWHSGRHWWDSGLAF
ncbi:MAG: hypothetical protein M1833_000106 [Piccolia ochrophora]|nr:MAG: hypothetical protein M1833_000106 [Piccolia ochrophora]